MASPKANLEGKKIAKKVMNFIDANSFDPVYDAIEKKRRLRCVYWRNTEMRSYRKNDR